MDVRSMQQEHQRSTRSDQHGHQEGASSAHSDTSELSMLSRSPSPPLELQNPTIHLGVESTQSSDGTSENGDNQLDAHAGKRKSSSEQQRDTKRAKLMPQGSRNTTHPVTASTPLGTLKTRPKEVRQMIFALALDIPKPVTMKPYCCEPQAKCPKHGPLSSLTGRFNILRVSKEVNEEASWVLYNKGKLLSGIQTNMCRYLDGYVSQSTTRLGAIPNGEGIQAMWQSAAKYRFVTFCVPPTRCISWMSPGPTIRLLSAVSLLLKAWQDRKTQPTALVPHTVEVHLDALFNGIAPFNIHPPMVMNYMMNPAPADLAHEIATVELPTSVNLKKLVSIISHNRGSTEWCVVVQDIATDEQVNSARYLASFEETCAQASLKLKKIPGFLDDD